jgi:integrase|tara:strand:+ start:504 stop:1613 length:1110 start_codon:yes stop_codon:yes gene_type:complete
MATLRKRGKNWQATVRRKGYPLQIKTVSSRTVAQAWANKVEASMDSNSFVDPHAPPEKTTIHTVGDIIDSQIESYDRFNIQIDKSKLCALGQIKDYFNEDHPAALGGYVAGQDIHDLTVDQVLNFAAYRRQTVGANTLQKQMYYFRQALNESLVKLQDDPVKDAIEYLMKKKLITRSKERTRRLEKGEYERFKAAAGQHKWIMLAVDIAIKSGMRMGEIYTLQISDGRPLTAQTIPFGEGYIDLERNLIGLWRKNRKAENGKQFHVIPLFKDVRERLLRSPNNFGKGETLFKFGKAKLIGDTFAKICTKAGIEGLTFHDLRHEAITLMFEPKAKGGRGLKIEEVKLVSGHSSFDQLGRYTNLRPEDLPR